MGQYTSLYWIAFFGVLFALLYRKLRKPPKHRAPPNDQARQRDENA